MGIVPLAGFVVSVFICTADVPCNRDNALYYDTHMLHGARNAEMCMDRAKAQARSILPIMNKAEDFVFEGQRLKFHIECNLGVDT